MWYASFMPQSDLERAALAVENAQGVRKFHRRRSEPGTNQRERDIAVALERIKEAMRPLRSEIARFPYRPNAVITDAEKQRLRDASKALQTERRKLHKMKRR